MYILIESVQQGYNNISTKPELKLPAIDKP